MLKFVSEETLISAIMSAEFEMNLISSESDTESVSLRSFLTMPEAIKSLIYSEMLLVVMIMSLSMR